MAEDNEHIQKLMKARDREVAQSFWDGERRQPEPDGNSSPSSVAERPKVYGYIGGLAVRDCLGYQSEMASKACVNLTR